MLLGLLYVGLAALAGPRAPPGHAVVIGAGMSGLAVAGRLARRGLRVTIVEQNVRERAGGRLGEHTLTTPDGHRVRFETGASLLLLPRVYARTFHDLGLELPARLERVSPSYRVFLDDALLSSRGPIDLGGDPALLDARLALEVEEPQAAAKVSRFFASARANLRCGLPLFIEGDSAAGLRELPSFLEQAASFWPLQNQAEQLRRLFPSSPRLRALLSFDSLYVGLSPYGAPAVFSLLAALECDRDSGAEAAEGPGAPAGAVGPPAEEQTTGVWYMRGGMAQIARALADGVERMENVQCRYGTAVRRITTTLEGASAASGVRSEAEARREEEGAGQALGEPGRHLRAAAPPQPWRRQPPARVTGVELAGGEVLVADIVVCSADLAAAEPALLPPALCRSRYDPPDCAPERAPDRAPESGRTEYSTSTVTFLWAVRRRRKAAADGADATGAAAAPPSTARQPPQGSQGDRDESESWAAHVPAGEAETDALCHHNVFLAASAPGSERAAGGGVDDPFRAAWDAILAPGGAQGTFPPPGQSGAHMYVCVSARTDPSACAPPPGQPDESEQSGSESGQSGAARAYDNLMVLVPVPALDERWSDAEAAAAVGAWRDAARELALGALERAGCTHIREDITAEAVTTPLDWRSRFGLRRGAVFGLSHGLSQLSLFRPSQATPKVDGLFFTGASTQPGNGVPLVLISAEQAAAKAGRWVERHALS